MADTATAKFETPSRGEPYPDVPDAYRTFKYGNRKAVKNPQRNRGQPVWIFRMTSRSSYFEVQVVEASAGEVLQHGVYEVPADRSLVIGFGEPSDYSVNVYDFTSSKGATSTFHEEGFDCNSKSHWLYITESDEFRLNTQTTLMDC
jgi:hypothetical protein